MCSNCETGSKNAPRVGVAVVALFGVVVAVTLQWHFFLPVALLVGPVLRFGMTAVWAAQVGYRCLQGLIFAWIWRSLQWMHIEV